MSSIFFCITYDFDIKSIPAMIKKIHTILAKLIVSHKKYHPITTRIKDIPTNG